MLGRIILVRNGDRVWADIRLRSPPFNLSKCMTVHLERRSRHLFRLHPSGAPRPLFPSCVMRGRSESSGCGKWFDRNIMFDPQEAPPKKVRSIPALPDAVKGRYGPYLHIFDGRHHMI